MVEAHYNHFSWRCPRFPEQTLSSRHLKETKTGIRPVLVDRAHGSTVDTKETPYSSEWCFDFEMKLAVPSISNARSDQPYVCPCRRRLRTSRPTCSDLTPAIRHICARCLGSLRSRTWSTRSLVISRINGRHCPSTSTPPCPSLTCATRRDWHFQSACHLRTMADAACLAIDSSIGLVQHRLNPLFTATRHSDILASIVGTTSVWNASRSSF